MIEIKSFEIALWKKIASLYVILVQTDLSGQEMHTEF